MNFRREELREKVRLDTIKGEREKEAMELQRQQNQITLAMLQQQQQQSQQMRQQQHAIMAAMLEMIKKN